MAGFLGMETPVFDIAQYYEPGERRDLLVRNIKFGAALAEHFGEGRPDHSAVLMRGHGFTVQGSNIMEVVARAIYTQQNASIQTTALLTRAAYTGSGQKSSRAADVHYLSEEETQGATEMSKWSAGRPWRLWLREVEAQGMYVNTA